MLYRCGQPSADDLETLIRTYRLRTVVSLRGVRDANDPDAWEQSERAVCASLGVEFVSLPCNHKTPPSAEQVRSFLELVRDPQRRPVLVHCRLGQQRTLLFCALCRVYVQGVSPQEALREMDALGFGIRRRRHRRLLQAFYDYTAAPVGG